MVGVRIGKKMLWEVGGGGGVGWGCGRERVDGMDPFWGFVENGVVGFGFGFGFWISVLID